MSAAWAPRDGWPVPVESLEAARDLLRSAEPPIVLVPDGDADGLSSGVLLVRALERLGWRDVSVLLPGKGEHLHSEGVRERLASAGARTVVALDQGSRAGEVLPGARLLVVDHHRPRGLPPGSVVVNGHDRPPVVSSSVLAWLVASSVADVGGLAWLGALGLAGDLGADNDLPGMAEMRERLGVTALREAVALLNAPRRAAEHDVSAAWGALLRAKGPSDIAKGRVAGVELLRSYRSEVAAEVSRCARVPPRFAGRFALLLFSSAAKVHPLVATRWARRLRDKIVVAANAGYLPGKVNFALRSAGRDDLLAVLHGLGAPLPGDAGYGHAQATGGSLGFDDFAALLAAMGFEQAASLSSIAPPASS